jgi:predicted DNA-binding protein
MSEKQENQIQTAIRLPESLIDRADKLAEQLSQSQPGMTFTRADAIRIGLHRGFTELEAESKKKR